jgi:thiamine kinase-like enzyme
MLGPQPEFPCHNDLLNANFVRSAAGIRIVDWEYAAMGDRFFDLANFSVNHALTEGESDLLLEATSGSSGRRASIASSWSERAGLRPRSFVSRSRG